MYFLFSSFWNNNSRPKNICYTSLMLSFDAEATLNRLQDNCPAAEAGCLTTTWILACSLWKLSQIALVWLVSTARGGVNWYWASLSVRYVPKKDDLELLLSFMWVKFQVDVKQWDKICFSSMFLNNVFRTLLWSLKDFWGGKVLKEHECL